MSNQERLNQIKRNFKNGYDFNPSSAENSAIQEDFAWLIQQVEHWKKAFESENKIAGKLQGKVEKLENQLEVTGNELSLVSKENQRYKQSLEEIARWDEMVYSAREMGKFARQALQGGNDNE